MTWFSGTFRDVGRITLLLEEAQRECNLITPATSIGSLPEGWEVSVSSVLVNVDRDTYPAEDNYRARCLGRTSLDQIAAAAAVSWEPPPFSGRQDDGRDPRYCRYLVTGRYRHFDGQWVTRPDEYEMDLRGPSSGLPDGGADYKKILDEALRNNRDADARLLRVRRDILSLTITKARNRAIRDLGLRSSYTADELARPFVVVRMAFTGASDDVELRRQFALLNAQRMLGAEAALYGSLPAAARAPALPPAQTNAPPGGDLGAAEARGARDPEVASPNLAGSTAPGGRSVAAPEPECPRCHNCGSDQGVQTSTSGAIVYCQRPRCLELAKADAIRNHDLLPSLDDRERTQTAALSRAASYQPSGTSPATSGPRRPAPPARDPGGARASGFRVPGRGPDGGLPIEEASTEVLADWEQSMRRKLRDGRTPAQYVEQDTRLVDAIRRELDMRVMDAAEMQGEIPH